MNEEYEAPTPLTDDEYFYSQLPAGVKSVIEDMEKVDPIIGDMLKSVALNSYAKGRLDATDESLKTIIQGIPV